MSTRAWVIVAAVCALLLLLFLVIVPAWRAEDAEDGEIDLGAATLTL